MAAPKPIVEEVDEEEWLTTYADAITLLMAFFVMLLTFSKYDIPAMQEAMKGIQNQVGSRNEKSPTKVLKDAVQDIVYNMQADQAVKVQTDDQGVVIELASSAFYKPGSAELREEAIPVLNQLSQTLLSSAYAAYQIEVEGHTDDDPISTVQYPSNWELSTNRATRVVRFLIEKGMLAQRLKAAGYAETQPKVPNRTDDGTPIRENQAENRRVNIRMFPMSLEMRKRLAPEKKGISGLIETTGPAVPPVVDTGIPKDDGGEKVNQDMMQDVLKGLSGTR